MDNQFKEMTENYLIRCDVNDKKHKGEVHNRILTIDKNGVVFQFECM